MSISDRKAAVKHVRDLSPLPKADVSLAKRKKGRPTSHACEFTSSPYKQSLENPQAGRQKESCEQKLKKLTYQQGKKHNLFCKIQSPSSQNVKILKILKLVQREDVTKHNLELPSSNEAQTKAKKKTETSKEDNRLSYWPVVFLYEGRIYPGQITNKTDSLEQNPTIEVKGMKNAGINKFRLPLKTILRSTSCKRYFHLYRNQRVWAGRPPPPPH